MFISDNTTIIKDKVDSDKSVTKTMICRNQNV